MWQEIDSYLRYLYHSHDLIPMLIELLLIGIVVYAIMRFLRGTGGEKLFRGIVFIILAVWAVELLSSQLNLDLERINLLFKYFLGAVLVVTMIAFQPELRRGLMRLGGTRLGRSAAPEMEGIIEQIVDAAALLSQTQIGAVIAIEREVGLGDLVAGGTAINAQVSAALLNTIFWPGSPLHDMGVVIRRGKIAAAGVQFPLAEHGEYDRTLGSRHRAAIGLSKETDAVVLVISEETGRIGLAAGSKLTRFLTLEQLRRQLLDLLIPLTAKEAKEKKRVEAQDASAPQGPSEEPAAVNKPSAAPQALNDANLIEKKA